MATLTRPPPQNLDPWKEGSSHVPERKPKRTRRKRGGGNTKQGGRAAGRGREGGGGRGRGGNEERARNTREEERGEGGKKGTAGAGELWPRAGGTSHKNKARDYYNRASALCVDGKVVLRWILVW